MATALAWFYSRQPGNLYTGGGNENAMMFKLAQQQVALLRGMGFDVDTPASNSDENGDGILTYADNVAWVSRRTTARRLAGLPAFAASVSNHSNAAGDSCVLSGSDFTSRAFAIRLMEYLNAAAFMPYGDVFTYNARKVSEVVSPAVPIKILIEWGQHDKADYAAWLREHINNGQLAVWSTDAFAKAFGTPAVTEPSGNAPAFPLSAGRYFGPRYPLSNVRSVSGYYNKRANGKPGHDGLAAWQTQRHISADGLYGPQTKSEALAVQAAHGLARDGLIGAQTWARSW